MPTNRVFCFMADSILRLRVDSAEYNNKLKQAVNGLLQMEAECRKVGGTLGVLEKDQLEYVKSLGQMETASKTAQGKIRELSNAYLNFSLIYKRMSDEEKRDEGGKALANSLTQLKSRLDAAKKDLADVEKEMNGASAAGVDFNSVLASLGQRFGINSELMGALTSGTLATTAAVTASAAAVAAATKMWADYNDELNRQTNVTTVTTGLKGDAATDLTIGVRALAKTYDVDFREAINAANTLIQQFGVSGEQALSLLQDGMQGMIAGDGGKLLSMIQQYAPSFRDAGIEASQLVAVIQNSEGGLFTDQNMQAIVMGIRNIRLMTKQTSEALAQLGIDGQEMSRKLEDGSMTIFDALRQVSGAIDNVDSGSKAAGEVMQSVFGRQGTMAGTKLGEAIATLNTNLEETKTQTGEVGENLRRVNERTEELERSLEKVFQTAHWDEWATSLKVFALDGLTFTVDWIGKMKELNEQWNLYYIAINKAATALGLIDGKTPQGSGSSTPAPSNPSSKPASTYTETVDSRGNIVKATRNGQDVTGEVQKIKNKTTVTTPTVTTPRGGSAGAAWAPIAMQAVGGLSFGRRRKDVQADLSRAQGAYDVAEDESSRAAAKKMVEAYQQELETMKNEGDVTKGGFADAYNHDIGKDIDRLSKELKKDGQENLSTGVEQVKQMGAMVGGIQQMISGIELLGIEIPDGFQSILGGMQGIITILEAIQTVNTVGTALGLFSGGGIVPHAASGYFVPGNSMSNDRVPIMANSGELILNRAEQGVIASELQHDRNVAGGTPYVDGEKIYLGMNNFLRRSGKGEIVTSRR